MVNLQQLRVHVRVLYYGKRLYCEKKLVASIFFFSMSNYLKNLCFLLLLKKCLVTFKFCESCLVYQSLHEMHLQGIIQSCFTQQSKSTTLQKLDTTTTIPCNASLRGNCIGCYFLIHREIPADGKSIEKCR